MCHRPRAGGNLGMVRAFVYIINAPLQTWLEHLQNFITRALRYDDASTQMSANYFFHEFHLIAPVFSYKEREILLYIQYIYFNMCILYNYK